MTPNEWKVKRRRPQRATDGHMRCAMKSIDGQLILMLMRDGGQPIEDSQAMNS